MAKMKVFKAGVEVKSLELAKEHMTLLIGRGENCDIRLDGRAVGREHAVFSLEASGMIVRKRSQFGFLFVNGAEVSESFLKPGDVVSIAEYQISIEDEPMPVSLAVEKPVLAELSTAQLGQPQQFEQIQPELLQESVSVENTVTPALSGLEVENVRQQTMVEQIGSAQSIEMDSEKTAVLSLGTLVAKLLFAPGSANTEEYELSKPEITIGRGTTCEVVLNDKKASRKHLVIKRVGATFIAQDLGTGNGTFINGEKITQQELSSGDVLKIADTEFHFQAVSQEYLEQENAFLSVPPVEKAPNEMLAQPVPDLNPVSSDYSASSSLDHSASASIQPAFQGMPPNFQGVPGIAVAGPPPRESLLEKFKKQPPARKILIAACILGALYLFTEEEQKKEKGKNNKDQLVVTDKVDAAFKALPPEKRQFIVNAYQLAFDLYKNQEFEKSLFEVKKVLDILPQGYKDSKDIKVYAEKAIEIERSKAEEKKRKEDEERLRQEVATLVSQAQELVDQSKDEQAKLIFAQVLEKDPENPTVLRLSQLLEEREVKRKQQEEERKELDLKRNALLGLISEGRNLIKAGKYYDAIERMIDAPVIGYNDPKLLKQAQAISEQAKEILKSKSKPYLDEGKAALAEGNYTKARDAYLKAIKIDTRNKEAKEGLIKIRAELHTRSKKIYTEALIAEAVSDFAIAKTKYKECLDQAMPDDIYFGRCKRKFKRFEFVGGRETASSSMDEGGGSEPQLGLPAGAASDPQKPTLPTPPMELEEE